MSEERTIPLPATGDLATFSIKVDGEDVSPETQIGNIIVRHEYNKISSATLVILDGDVAQQDFAISNSDVFIPGKEVEILAGYHSNESSIFKGFIVAQGLKVRRNKPSQLVVECKDKMLHSIGTRKSRYYVEMSDSDIIEEIAGEYGVETDIESTSVGHAEMVQFGCSDWDFVLTRAEANGKLVLTDNGKLIVKAPAASGSADLSLSYGATLMEFEASMDARNQFPSSKSMSWDYAEQARIEEEADDPGLEEAGNLSTNELAGSNEYESHTLFHSGKVVDEELKAWADARLYRSRLAKILGRARCQGNSEIFPGGTLGLTGVGDRYNGNHLVTSIRHQLDADNWVTDIRFGMPMEWLADKQDVTAKPAAALLPAVSGLQIGICKQIGEDPDGEDRILVVLPIIDPDGDGVWARIATLDAGENRGSFSVPR